MTVTNTYTDSVLSTGNGVTTAFTTRFIFALDSEVLVYLVTIATGAETLQTITTDYTLTGAGTGSAGTVTFNSAPSNSYYIKIVRSTALTQTTDYVSGTKFPADTHEAALDKLTRIVQEAKRDGTRAPQLPLSSANYPAVFPDWSSATASHLLRVKSTYDGLEWASSTDAALSASLTPTANYMIVGDGSAWTSVAPATVRTALGLGSMATQAASAVAITGGSVAGITDLAVADGGTGASTAGDARTNLGLGTLATQDSSAVSITGGSIAGITDLAVADGGTGSSNASDARTALGLAIGTNVQAYDATLAALASYNTNGILTQTAADTFVGRTLTGAANQITVTNGDGVSGNPTLSIPYNVNLGSSATAQSSLTFYEDTDNGSNYMTIQPPAAITSSFTLTMPDGNGTAGYLLSNNGSGVLSWVAPSAATAGGADTNVQYNSSGTITGDANFTYDGAGTAYLSTSINLGHATDTTITRVSAGLIAVEGSTVVLRSAAASQADQETATSTTTFVSPGRQQFHPSAAKAWVAFTSITSTAVIGTASYNITSLTDNGSGDTTVVFGTDFSGADTYTGVVCSDITEGSTLNTPGPVNSYTRAAGSHRIVTVNSAGSGQDQAYTAGVWFGDQ